MRRLKKIGKIVPKCAKEVKESRLGIGFEKLDRGMFDPELAYDKVAALGVKWIRLQSGWMRTEKEKGVYDFTWLDDIVDNLIARGLRPWINLTYGNPLYTEIAKRFFGAVGCPPIDTEEERSAWCRYVTALVANFKGKVEYFEIWNEPDQPYAWRRANNLTEKLVGVPDGKSYGEFAIMTAKAIHAGNPDAKVIGLAMGNCKNTSFLFEAIATGMCDYFDAVTYHTYTGKPFRRTEVYHLLADAVHADHPEIEVIQGESGVQSECGIAGALYGMNLTPTKQMTMLLRLLVSDLASGVKFTSYFSAMDMSEALNGTVDDAASYRDFAYFGLIGAEFDENGIANNHYHEKPSYFAMQTLASLFAEDFTVVSLPYRFRASSCRYVNGADCDDPTLMKHSFRLADGKYALVYWNHVNPLTQTYEGTVSVEIPTNKTPQWIDLRNGDIYSIPETMMTRHDFSLELHHIPVFDFPVMLTWE